MLDCSAVARKLQKWCCPMCTYENWPKADRCVMCYSSRLAGPSGSGSPKEKKRGANQSDDNDESSCKKSPKSSHASLLHEVAAAAVVSSSSSNESIATSIVPIKLHPDDETRAVALANSDDCLRTRISRMDWLFLQACKSIMTSLDAAPVEAFLESGGEASRTVTQQDVQYLKKFGSIMVGHTLVHLAVMHHREDVLSTLLVCSSVSERPGPATVARRSVKNVPCHLSPEVAAGIRRQVAMSLRQRKGDFPCYFFSDLTTFFLPAKIYDLPPVIQQKLFDELLDRDVQTELEEECSLINWNVELTDRFQSRLYALWNRTAGDCLLDSVLQATWGVFDSENSLRQALSDSLHDGATTFYPQWQQYESLMASALQFQLDDQQWARDWEHVLHMASKPGSALEQAHIFALTHIIRRPIIVYGVRMVKSFSGDYIGYAPFEGIYLPLLWEPSFCWRSPIVLGYTRGHFTALVPMEPEPTLSACPSGSIPRASTAGRYIYLPLQDSDRRFLPLHFLNTVGDMGREQLHAMRTWMDCVITEGGLLACKMKLHRLPPGVSQMTDDWLGYYQALAKSTTATSIPSSSTQPCGSTKPTRAASQSPCESHATHVNTSSGRRTASPIISSVPSPATNEGAISPTPSDRPKNTALSESESKRQCSPPIKEELGDETVIAEEEKQTAATTEN